MSIIHNNKDNNNKDNNANNANNNANNNLYLFNNFDKIDYSINTNRLIEKKENFEEMKKFLNTTEISISDNTNKIYIIELNKNRQLKNKCIDTNIIEKNMCNKKLCPSINCSDINTDCKKKKYRLRGGRKKNKIKNIYTKQKSSYDMVKLKNELFKNNKKLLKELSEKDFRLLKFNSKLINPFHTYLMYSLVPSELNELSFKDLNYVVEIFKKKINKFVKKKFNKNYVNANSQKDLDIFTELCHLNISIFDTNFDNLHSSTKNKKYTKRLYLINRDNDLFLLIKKDKKGLKLKLGNNVLKPIQSGGTGKEVIPIYGRAPTPSRRDSRIAETSMTYKSYSNALKHYNKTLEKPIYPFSEKYYNKDKVNDFLRTYCEKLIKKKEQTDDLKNKMEGLETNNQEYKEIKEKKGKLNKEKLEHFKEIIIAAFTDHMRDQILLLIKSIEEGINLKMYDNGNGIMGVDAVGKKNPVRIVISGGSGFNNLIEKENRPISPDIDVKLCLHTQEAIDLHKHMTQNKNVNQNVNDKNIKNLQMVVAKQLLIVRTHLFNVMEDKAKKFSKDIETRVGDFNNMFQNLYQHCKKTLMGEKEIPFLKSLDPIVDEKWRKNFSPPVKVLVRETLMKRGIDGDPENNPYKLHDVFLYSLDLPFNGKTGFESLAGILDIVVSIPGHIGYILPSYSTNTLSTANILGCYNITIDYYTYELIKLITYGLRTTNKKILKDLERYRILLNLDPRAEGPVLIDLLHINKVINAIKDDTLKNELKELLSVAINVGLKNSPQQQSQQQQPSLKDKFNENAKKLLIIQSDTQDSDEHLINLDEQCSQDVINQSSDDTYNMNNMNKYYTEYITESGSLQPFVIDCIYHGVCGDKGGGSKKNKQIGGGGPCGNVEMLSLSKVFQMMVNNKSMEGFNLNNLSNINLVPDKNVDASLNYNVDIPKINFEKLTEYKETNKKIDFGDEYLSTKASSRVPPFRMSINKNPIITNICNHLINKVIITNKNINRLCYCYESDEYKPGKLNAPSEQEYAAFLLTQCQVLKTINKETKELYSAIDSIANPNVNMIP